MPKPKTTPEPVKTASRKTVYILSAGAKGGPGKSFLVKNLAGAAVSDGMSVATVDFDTQRTLTKWISRRENNGIDVPGIENYIADPDNEEAARDVLKIDDVNIVFVDTPPSIDHYPGTMKLLAQNVDLVLVPTKVGISDTESAEQLLEVLASWNVPTLAVINLVKISAKRPLKKAKQRIVGLAELSAVDIPDYTDFLVADEAGLGATEVSKCNGADAIAAFWADVKRIINRKTGRGA
ncbi:ParA family protein [Gluconobacter cerinus]